MNTSPRKIDVFQYNPPLRVLSSYFSDKALAVEVFKFALPKLKRQITHDRVSRYFLRSGNQVHSQLD